MVKFAFVRLPSARFLARALSQTLPHLAIFAVMLLALGSQGAAFWECEGQQCGVTAWTCCCVQPSATKDAQCGEAQTHFARGEHASEAGSCAVDCHCTLVVQDHKPSVSSTQFSFASPILFVVPLKFAPTFETPVLAELPQLQPSRGPPLRAVFLASSPLRGPPVA